MGEARITIVVPIELKERIQLAANAAYLPFSIWCRQQLVNALPQEIRNAPIKEIAPTPKEEAEILDNRIMDEMKKHSWVTPRKIANILGVDIDACNRALLIMLSNKVLILHPEDSRFETPRYELRLKTT